MTEAAYGRRGRQIECHEATTNGSGNAVFTYDKQFTELPVITIQMVSPPNSMITHAISAESTSGCTVTVRAPVVVSVLGNNIISDQTTAVSGQVVRVCSTEM